MSDDEKKAPATAREIDEAFLEEIRSNDARRQLVALRDLVAEELTGNRCKACQMLQIRSGEIASLAARLQKIIEDLQNIPIAEGEQQPTAENKAQPTSLSLIRSRREATGTDDTGPDPEVLGTKQAPRRQGGRRTSEK